MRIFITQKKMRDRHGSDLDALETAYIRFFLEAAILPANVIFIPVPNRLEHARLLFSACIPALLVLTGGNNTDPITFGVEIALDDLAPKRDEVEAFLLEQALSRGIPVLGICRGFHFINVYLGGRLSLNLQNHPPAVPHICQYQGKEYTVNSYHHHGIKTGDLAAPLTPIAFSCSGEMVEAFATSQGGGILGVQWHPERPGADTELFRVLFEKYLRNKLLS